MLKSPLDLQRRSFFKYAATGAFSVFLAPLIRAGATAAYGAALPLLKENDPTASALGYNASADKVDVKKWAKKAGPDGKSQKCSVCTFYTSIDAKTGKCQIFPNNTVTPGGWCNTWTKKA